MENIIKKQNLLTKRENYKCSVTPLLSQKLKLKPVEWRGKTKNNSVTPLFSNKKNQNPSHTQVINTQENKL